MGRKRRKHEKEKGRNINSWTIRTEKTQKDRKEKKRKERKERKKNTRKKVWEEKM